LHVVETLRRPRLATFPRRVVATALLLTVFSATAEERFMRYRLLAPQTPSIATLLSHSHVYAECSWNGLPLPGVISDHGLYIAPGAWSPWRELPAPPMWGDIRMDLRGAAPITACQVEIQVASWPEDKFIARTLTIENGAGNRVGFNLPPNILKDPDLIESFPEDFQRRRKVADAVAVPENRRPKLLSFSGHNVTGEPSVTNSEAFELETSRRLGFNTYGGKWPGAQYLFQSIYRLGPEEAAAFTIPPEDAARTAFISIADEPGYNDGFSYFWAKTGEQGFCDYLKTNNVSPAFFGKKDWAEVHHILRGQPVAVDASLEQRRLWFWSCRYTYAMSSEYWATTTRILRKKYPDVPVTLNISDHSTGLLGGAMGAAMDIFEDGRRQAVTMFWSEDWFAPGIDCWSDGMYQKIAYYGDLLRGAARYQGFNAKSLGFHVVGNGWAPKATDTDVTVAMRVGLLLQQGCKTFSYFNYGPTLNCTVDFWADHAGIARGVADTSKLVGGEKIEPYLYEGMPVPPQTCLIYSTENFYWLETKKTQDDEFERQHIYCMLQQGHIPVDIIAGADLQRFIKDYKAAYVVDHILVEASAQALKTWVEAGGVLVLGPESATYNEFNEPMSVFPAAPGQHRVGKGWMIRFKENEGKLWRETSVALNRANPKAAVGHLYWYADFDAAHRDVVCQPALALAKIVQPVLVGAPAVIAEPLVSVRGVAVPLVNMRAMYKKGGTNYEKLEVTLADGRGVTRAWSSRQGALVLTRVGEAVSVTLPLDCTDIVVFGR
jgi:hypothetical protein